MYSIHDNELLKSAQVKLVEGLEMIKDIHDEDVKEYHISNLKSALNTLNIDLMDEEIESLIKGI